VQGGSSPWLLTVGFLLSTPTPVCDIQTNSFVVLLIVVNSLVKIREICGHGVTTKWYASSAVCDDYEYNNND
jgi:hypothetical protein